MLDRRLPGSLFLLMAPTLVVAETLEQTIPFDYDVNSGPIFPVIESFDTQGGQRELTGVTFEFNHNFDLEMFVESTGPTAINSGDFLVDFTYITLYQLGTVDGGKKEGGPSNDPPFFGPGAFFAESVTGALAAYDGVPGNDGPDAFRRNFSDTFTVTQHYDGADPDVLAAVTDVGQLTTVFGGFSETFFRWINDPNWPAPGLFPEYPDDAALWISTPTFRHSGDITITYEFVPEPATAGSLAALALFALRRRR